MHLLFVCTANIIRSPMAEALARHLLAARLNVAAEALEGRGWRLGSAGVAAWAGEGMGPEAAQVLADAGVPVAEHRSRPVTLELLARADRVWGMERRHVALMLEWIPAAAGKIETLDPQGDIADPVGRGLEAHRRAAAQIRAAIELRLRSVLDPA